ncbi:hypothetical protein PN36_17580 [Candidatus Thiomargarita nelsonii]|uniref:Uncharacterized protein n=1 Tax=Candidatus Thiomargarita nelsonii TaxID=1003181 RepID=A0A0A6P7F0_9GAMM|nr:hypothetical protein PN36_17580 [Candidatus Thiomargarita nelsonii]
MVARLLKIKPIVIYGEQTRDFINIKVVVSANILSMNANQQGAQFFSPYFQALCHLAQRTSLRRKDKS